MASLGLQIAQAVEARLQLASVSLPGGVKTPPAGLSVERERVSMVTRREVDDGPHIVVSIAAEPKIDRDHWKSPHTVRHLELLIGVYVLANDIKGADALDAPYLWVVHALQSDPTFGGLANWVSEEASENAYTKFPESGDLIAGRELKLWINFHTRTDDPEVRSN
jgi:hypothetical protein